MVKVVIFMASLLAVAYSLPQHFYSDIEAQRAAPAVPVPQAVDKSIREYTWEQTGDQTNYS